jgi:hypothetical protein
MQNRLLRLCVIGSFVKKSDDRKQLPKLIQGSRFTGGVEVIGNSTPPQAQVAA